jgi:hypothetical protein
MDNKTDKFLICGLQYIDFRPEGTLFWLRILERRSGRMG